MRRFNSSLAVVTALMVLAGCGAAAQTPPAPLMVVADATPQQMAAYRRQLADWLAAREAFESEAGTYWSDISDKRALRNAKRRSGQMIELDDYVLSQPPVYSGPPKPVDPSGAPEQPGKPRQPLPVVADFLANAQAHFQFAPTRPANEMEYKRAYARTAGGMGLSRDQAVRVYGFESGGNGKYDVQAGLESERPGARAISTALGYNQLLVTNTIDLLAEHGSLIVASLRDKAKLRPPSAAMDRKIAVVQHMIAFCKTVPNTWSEHEKLAVTPRGIAVHVLNLDIDVGPMLQTLKLMDSVNFARRKGYQATLSASELEMMNLTGDGNGFDMVSMPKAVRDRVPTSNFFQRRGYERNPVAIRNNVVSKLIAATDGRMDREITSQGARDLAAAFASASF